MGSRVYRVYFQSFIYLDCSFCLMTRPLTSLFQLSSTLFSLFSSALAAWISMSWFHASIRASAFSWNWELATCKFRAGVERLVSSSMSSPDRPQRRHTQGGPHLLEISVEWKKTAIYISECQTWELPAHHGGGGVYPRLPDGRLHPVDRYVDRAHRKHLWLELLHVPVLVPRNLDDKVMILVRQVLEALHFPVPSAVAGSTILTVSEILKAMWAVRRTVVKSSWLMPRCFCVISRLSSVILFALK